MNADAQSDPAARVSVISIFHNEEAYLSEAIDSVLAQDVDGWELLLVDDGSTDGSAAIAKSYAARDPRVRYIDHPEHANLGMSASRNAGLVQALGEFVAFIDGDDRWRPSKLREQLDHLERLTDVDAVGGSVNYWSSHAGGTDRLVPSGHVRNRPIPPGEATLAMYPLGKADAPSMSDLLFRREAIDKVGGFEEQFRGAYEDQVFLSKLYLSATLYFTDKVWSDYRLHDASCMAEVQRQGTYADTRLRFLEWYGEHLATTRHRADAAILAALSRALAPHRTTLGRARERARSVPGAATISRAARATYDRARTRMSAGPAILMYHRIADESFDPWQLAVSPAHFAEHAEWIARERTPLALDTFAELNASGKLPPNAIAVTFDDAYASIGTTAAPLLEKLAIPATVFVSPELTARGQEFWWDELERVVLDHDGEALEVGGRRFELGEQRDEDRQWLDGGPARTPRQHAYRALWSIFYGRSLCEIDGMLADLRAQTDLSSEPRASHRPLRREEVRATASKLIAFGSHALTHPSLPQLPAEERKREIADSMAACAALSGTAPTTFAYPFGDYVEELQSIVAAAGFTCACKADGRFVTRKSQRFALPRLFVRDMGARQLALQLGRP